MKAMFDYDELNDDRDFLLYTSKPNEEPVVRISIISRSFYEEINQIASDNLTGKIMKEYEKGQEEFSEDFIPPNENSLNLALRFSKDLNGYKTFIKSVCTIRNGGFRFRFQKNETEYIDIDIYNEADNLSFIYSNNGEKAKALYISLQEIKFRLKKLLGANHSLSNSNKPKSNKKMKEILTDLKGKIQWEGNLGEMRQSRI
jgi:hypothetical protein